MVGHNYAVSARINLLDVPTLMNLNVADAGIRAEEAAVRAARQDLVVRFADGYLGLLKAQQEYQITRKEFERVTQLHEQSQMMLKAGMGDIIAVYEAKARQDSVAADITRSEGNLRLAEQKLSTLVGRSINEVQDYAPLTVLGAQPDDLAWWLDTMEKNDPIIRQGMLGLERSGQELRAVKAEHLPFLQGSGGYTSSKGTAFLPEVETRQWYVGASLTIPIYSGGETSAKVRRAVANQSGSKGLLDDLRKQRSENLKQSYYNLVYNVALVKSLEQRLASAEVQLNAVKKGRSIGTRTAIDLLNAEQAYTSAQRDYRSALYDNVLKNILLKNAAGILDDTVQVPMAASADRPAASAPAPAPAVPVPVPVPVQAVSQPMVQLPEQPQHGATVAGIGVLLKTVKQSAPLQLFEKPDSASQLLTGCSPRQIPQIRGKGQQAESRVLVTDATNSWVQVVCTQTASAAWIEVGKEYQFIPWKEFLKEKQVQLLPGLSKEQYAVYDAEEKQVLQQLTPRDQLLVENVVEQWLLVRSDKVVLGWLRWRDPNGVLLVGVVQ